ncbi:MAG: LEA type 2 family protein [Bacteroidetes bacterium]|nr:LEA type 2 family protein [Bacteroidota bacterium]
MKQITTKITGRVIKRVILLFVIALAGLIIFYLFNPRKALKLVFPDLTNISYIKAVIKNDSAFTKISMVLQNKNPYKLDIDTLDFNLKLNDTSIAHQTIALKIEQARFDIDTIKLPLNLSIKKIRGLISRLQDQDSTSVEVSGYIVYQTLFGRAKINFDKKTPILVPIPPEIKVLKVERNGYNIRDKILKASATIEIINKGKNLDLSLTNIQYDMTVKNTLRSKGIISKPLVIKPHSSIIIKLPVEIEIYHPLKTVWLIKTDNDQLNYTLHIKCNVKENISESSFASPTEVTATGILELVK